MIIEVFKTNVTEEGEARRLVERIQSRFRGYIANFDLDDCDHILRIVSSSGTISIAEVISLVNNSGYSAEVLPDEIQVLDAL